MTVRIYHKSFGQHSIIIIMDLWGPSGPYTGPMEIVLNITLMSILIQNKSFLFVSTAATVKTEHKSNTFLQ